MALMFSKTYDALIDAGVSKEKAEAAAEELASQERRFAKIEADLFVVKWMIAGVYAVLTVAGVPSVWLLLRIAAKVGALA